MLNRVNTTTLLLVFPTDLIHPIIQLHVKTKSSIRTIAPTGTSSFFLSFFTMISHSKNSVALE